MKESCSSGNTLEYKMVLARCGGKSVFNTLKGRLGEKVGRRTIMEGLFIWGDGYKSYISRFNRFPVPAGEGASGGGIVL
jgi:hypothetical protein